MTVENIPETGLHIEIEAPEALHPALAALAGVREVSQLSAVFDLARKGAHISVTGQIRAQVGQICIVTLEPVETALEESVDLKFVPQLAESAPAKGETTGSHLAAEEPPEPLVGGKLDLGAVATEFLILGIDPYPRKTGVEFAPAKTGDGSAKPFAALEALKKRLGD